MAVTVEAPLQAVGRKCAPLVPAEGVAAGRGAGGSGAYVHPYRNISFKKPGVPDSWQEQLADSGEEVDWDRQRNRMRFKTLAAVSHALCQGGEEEAGMRLLGCGRWFRRFTFPCGTSKLVPYPCDSMFCPQCAGRRSKVLQERIFKRIEQKK